MNSKYIDMVIPSIDLGSSAYKTNMLTIAPYDQNIIQRNPDGSAYSECLNHHACLLFDICFCKVLKRNMLFIFRESIF